MAPTNIKVWLFFPCILAWVLGVRGLEGERGGGGFDERSWGHSAASSFPPLAFSAIEHTTAKCSDLLFLCTKSWEVLGETGGGGGITRRKRGYLGALVRYQLPQMACLLTMRGGGCLEMIALFGLR